MQIREGVAIAYIDRIAELFSIKFAQIVRIVEFFERITYYIEVGGLYEGILWHIFQIFM